MKTYQLFFNRLIIGACFQAFVSCFLNGLRMDTTYSSIKLHHITRSIEDNRQGPTSVAYSSLLNSNEQLFLVQFHLGCHAYILCNLYLLHLMFFGVALNSEVMPINRIQLCHLRSVSNEEFLTRSRSHGCSKSLSCVGVF